MTNSTQPINGTIHDAPANAQTEAPTFNALGVDTALTSILAQDGITTAFPIQAETLPDSLQGRDILGRGATGSGKTLAYVLPLVSRISGKAQPNRPLGLVLAPTRELANQINDVLVPLAKAYNLSTTTIYGGVRQSRQTNDLRHGADIVVGCPGRVEDLVEQGRLSFDDIQVTVLDEADEMADMGFLPSVQRIMSLAPEEGQRLLFSATLDHGVDTLVKRFLSNPKVHEVDSATAQVSTMRQHVFQVTAADKPRIVEKLASGMGKRIMFTRTKFQAEHLAADLIEQGIPAVELHGNLSQNQRDRNLRAFSEGDVRVLVATDVAARGMDVSGIELVAQIDPPADPKSFLHRSGRTARAGESGDVVTLVLPKQKRSTCQMLRRAGIDGQVVRVNQDSKELSDLVPQEAPVVEGWSLEQTLRRFDKPKRSRGGSRRSDRSYGSRRSDRSEGSRRHEHSGDSRRTDRFEHSEHSEHSEHQGRAGRSDRFERSDSFESTQRSQRFNRSDRFERSERSQRTNRSDRFTRSDRSTRFNHSDRSDRFNDSAKFNDSARTERKPRNERHEDSRRDGASRSEHRSSSFSNNRSERSGRREQFGERRSSANHKSAGNRTKQHADGKRNYSRSR